MVRYSCPACGRQQVLEGAEGPPPVCGACGTVLHLPDQALLAAASRPRRAPARVERRGPGAGWWALLVGLVALAAGIPTAILLLHRDTPVATESSVESERKAPTVGPTTKPQEESRADESSNEATAPPPSPPPGLPAPVPATEPAATEPSSSAPEVAVAPSAAPHVMPVTRPVDPAFGRPVVRRAGPEALTDEQVGQALQRGVDYLIAHMDDGDAEAPARQERFRGPLPVPIREMRGSTQWREGLHALCTYALLQAGRSVADERLNVKGEFMRSLIDRMKHAAMQADAHDTWLPVTYSRGLRAAALAVYARPEDRDAMKADVAWLVHAAVLGAYTYDDRYAGAGSAGPNVRFRPEDIPWDHSNSQYGLLGTWACAEVGIEVPTAYWRSVEDHWVRWQLHDGEWGYRKVDEGGSLSMTAAGIASLLVTSDWLGGGVSPRGTGRQEPYARALAAGLGWLEQGDHCLEVGGPKSFYAGYDRFSLERVGLASGFKEFGTHDWYRELATTLLQRQAVDGSWGGGLAGQDRLVETAYDVLFLARGRHPILLSKLRFDGAWANHPRDAANLARYAARELERDINWQVVSIDRDWTDWTDSPVLYLASNAPPNLTDEQYEKLRAFVDAGGLLFTQADDGSDAFNRWVAALAKRLWPAYPLAVLPDDHEVYKLNARVPTPHVRFQAVSNGSRLLLVHSPADLAASWQQRAERTHAEAFQLGLNLFLYATGKTPLRNRLLSPTTNPIAPPSATMRVARLRYDGPWDPEPAAWRSFSRGLEERNGVGIETVEVRLGDLKPETAPVAHLTGTAAVSFGAAEAEAVRAYVRAGGVLLIDACGGRRAFSDGLRSGLLAEAFAGTPPTALPADDRLMRASAVGMADLDRPRLRPYAIAALGDDQPSAADSIQVIRYGKGLVILSPLDVTTGLLGANTWGILGYEPSFARDFVQNLVMSVRGSGTGP